MASASPRLRSIEPVNFQPRSGRNSGGNFKRKPSCELLPSHAMELSRSCTELPLASSTDFNRSLKREFVPLESIILNDAIPARVCLPKFDESSEENFVAENSE